MLVKTNESQDAVQKHPYSIADLRADNPDVSFPVDPDDATLAQFNVFKVTPTTPPAYDDTTHHLVEVNPVKVGGIWNQQWEVEQLPPEQAAANVEALKSRSIAQIDRDVDAIYQAALGNRGPEYTDAETAAQAYKDAGYTTTVPADVQSWATAKGWTATQAADDILIAAAQLRGAKSAIRAARLLRKEQIKAATTGQDVKTAVTAWGAFAAAIRTQLGV